MSTRGKVIIAVVAAAVLVGIALFSVYANRPDAISVESGKVERKKDLVAIVSATGEIKPKEYVELQAEISGVITELYVKEGDVVEKDGLLLKIDPVQTFSETRAQEAILAAAEAEARNMESQISVQQGNLERDQAGVRVAETEYEKSRQTMELARATFERKQELFEDNLISRDTYEAAKNELIISQASLETAAARLEQSRTQHKVSEIALRQAKNSHESALSRVEQQRAMLERSKDLLSKTVIRSPLSGVITQLNVERGERAVPGTLNNPAATLMVIADLSVIEAELEVDETDIVDLRLGQKAQVKVDALPETPISGTVTEIGNSAIQKTGGQQEAKDFKVVVQLEDPPSSLRPGLSCTGEITTATRQDVLVIPIQALTIREFSVDENGDLIREKKTDDKEKGEEENDAEEAPEKKEFEGVFRISESKTEFIPVETGIVGAVEIEILEGLEEGESIVTGSYKTLRTLADGDSVEVEKSERG